MYVAKVSPAKASQLLKKGYDISDIRNRGRLSSIDMVLTRAQRDRLAASGVNVRLKRTRSGKTVRQLATAQAAAGFTVWRSWDEPGGIRDELYRVARNNRDLVKLKVLGHTLQGREIIALKVTKNARKHRDGSRPAALYSATQHAREWISTEVDRRALHWYIDQYNSNNQEIRKLLKHTELWFMVVANPDGYQYTFDHERLWRKNLHDNDGDGQTTGADGVDPNRNFNEHWNYDNEGSSSIFSSDTFRGTDPGSERETQAMQSLLRSADPETHANFHSYGPLILFPQGWLVGAPDADNPIYTALGGTDANPAIPGFDPGLSAEELYVTNGETTDFADANVGTISFTPELEEGCPGCGFVFPDNEALVQAEFQKTLPFIQSLARSADNPAKPETATGMTTKPFYLDQDEVDSENGALSMFDFKFKESYGDPQDVRILASKKLGKITARYRINGGRALSASTSEWKKGEVYGVGNANYYHVMRGFVRGTKPGDSVEVWFEGGGKKSDSFTYKAVSENRYRTLLLSAEDYTGKSPGPQADGPLYLDYYKAALDQNQIKYDVYDVDAHDRTAPDPLGVLSHYDAVLWYTGDDIVVRELNQFAGTSSRLALQELYSLRDFMNEGGRVGYVGKNAGTADTNGNPQYYDPFQNRDCGVTATSVAPYCRPLYGSGDGVNDVLEYWMGAGIVNIGAGANFDDEGNFLNAFDVNGVDNPLTGLAWGFNGADSAQNQDGVLGPNSYITTSGLMPASEYPQFNSWVAARYDRPGGPFDPHSGSYYVHSQIADVSYKRLTHTVNVPPGGGTLSFWTSYNTEPDWDFMFVEAHTVGQDDWTTLPDTSGNNYTSSNTGESCPEGWRDLHPHLDHYQTLDPDTGTCSPTGTNGGAWNAASGSSGGWQQWRIDLAPYAGKQIELSIAYASDWSSQGLGVFLDDVTLLGVTEDFETGLDGWTVSGAPEGSAPNANDFQRITGAGFPEGAAVAMDDSVLQGYGIEGITGETKRKDVVARTMQYLLR
jgi:hypothetical protein